MHPSIAKPLRAAVALSACAAFGCSREPAAAGAPLVGVSLMAKQDPFYQQLEAAMVRAAAAEKLAIRCVSAEKSSQKQLNQVEDFLTQRVAAIVLCPVDSEGAAAGVDKARRANVPVFTADVEARSPHVVCHVASDNVAGGRAAAEALAKAIGSEGEVLVIDHPEVSSVQDRVRGFEEGIARHPKIRIVGKPPGGGDRNRSDRAMQDALHAFPSLRGVFGINDNTVLGALSAVEAARRAEVKLVGYDGDPEARAAIARGSALVADVVQHPDRIGEETVRAVARHLRGEKVPARIPVEVGVVDAASLAAAPK